MCDRRRLLRADPRRIRGQRFNIGASRGARDTDQVAFGVGEVSDDELAPWILPGAQYALPAKSFGRLEC